MSKKQSANDAATMVPAQQQQQVTAGLDNFDYDKKILALTPAEKDRILEIGKRIDPKDTNSIMSYGAEISSQVARNSDSFLSTVNCSNNLEVNKYINDLLTELNGFEDDINKYSGTHKSALKRFWYGLPGIRKIATSLESVMNQYSSVATNVDKISQKLSTSRTVAIRDNSTLQQISENNQQYIRDIRELIMAAKLQDDAITQELEKMYAEGAETIEIQRVQNFQNRLRKRIEDLQTNAYIYYQNLFQIEAIKENNNALIEQSDNIVNHVIPMWKSQLPIAIMLKNQKATADSAMAVKETTRKLILTTSSELEKESVKIAKLSESAMVDMDTLKESTDKLINTIASVRAVHDKGAQDRKRFEEDVKSMCSRLNDAVAGLDTQSRKIG